MTGVPPVQIVRAVRPRCPTAQRAGGSRTRGRLNIRTGRHMPVTILIVEDDEELNDILHYNLVRVGYRVLQAYDGAGARALAQLECPDLIVLDIMLPDMDGWEVSRFFSEDPRLRDIPIVFLTAKSAREDFDESASSTSPDTLPSPMQLPTCFGTSKRSSPAGAVSSANAWQPARQ